MPWAMRSPNALSAAHGVGVLGVPVAGQGGEGDDVGLGERPPARAERVAVAQRVEVLREEPRARARGPRHVEGLRLDCEARGERAHEGAAAAPVALGRGMEAVARVVVAVAGLVVRELEAQHAVAAGDRARGLVEVAHPAGHPLPRARAQGHVEGQVGDRGGEHRGLGHLGPDALEHERQAGGVAADVGPHGAEHVVGPADDRHEVGAERDAVSSCSSATSSLGAPGTARLWYSSAGLTARSASASESAHEPAPSPRPRR